MGRLPVAALCVLLVLTALVGCGGDGEGEPLSKQEKRQVAYEEERAAYIEEADARCRRISERIEGELELYRRRLDSSSASASAKFVEEMAPRVEYEVRAIRILVLPNRDVEEVLAFLSAWVDDVQRAKRDPVAFVEAEGSFPGAEKLARRFGFEDCAAPLSAESA